MNELKTLKDILSPDNDWDETSEKKCGELLKAEAVKWVKNYRSWDTKLNGNLGDEIALQFMLFFNITEGDLKECEHDFGNVLLMSNPPQRRCIKCGYTEFVK